LIWGVWGFPTIVAVVIVIAAVAGAVTLLLVPVLVPLLVWTFVLYVRCTRQAIKGRQQRGER
jgi:fucose permease